MSYCLKPPLPSVPLYLLPSPCTHKGLIFSARPAPHPQRQFNWSSAHFGANTRMRSGVEINKTTHRRDLGTNVTRFASFTLNSD